MSAYQIAIELHYADMIADGFGLCQLQLPCDDEDFMDDDNMDNYYLTHEGDDND